ncbi:MAG: sodium:solute symporter [Gemmatimonadota bacterium]
MGSADLVVILVYFAVTLSVGLWVARNQRTAGDYFLGARNLPAWSVLLSIVATETSALTVISVPGIGARGDLTFLQLAFGYLVGRILVARWLLPGYFTGQQDTAYTRLERRFGVSTRRYMSTVFLVTRFLGDAVRVYASGIPLALITGWSIPTSILVMGVVTVIYTLAGGFKAVVWTDVFQWTIYIIGGLIALGIAWRLAGGAEAALAAARAAGKLRVIDLHVNLTTTYSFLGGIVGGALLSAASHGTDHLIVQRLLSTRSLKDAQVALIGSGVVVILQFTLFLLIGSAIWAAGLAPAGELPDRLFPRFIVDHMPTGISGLLVAGILAAAMGTHSSAINALASAATYDLYSSWTGRQDPGHLLKVGRAFSTIWGVLLVFGALFFDAYSRSSNTPIVVLALSIASVTYGALLGTYLLAGVSGIRGTNVVVASSITMVVMLIVIFAKQLSTAIPWLTPVGSLAWPWYVPLGTGLTLAIGWSASRVRPTTERSAA